MYTVMRAARTFMIYLQLICLRLWLYTLYINNDIAGKAPLFGFWVLPQNSLKRMIAQRIPSHREYF